MENLNRVPIVDVGAVLETLGISMTEFTTVTIPSNEDSEAELVEVHENLENPLMEITPIEEPQPEEEQIVHDMIPINSPTILLDSSSSRFSGATWFIKIQEQEIILAGLGGIGSHTAFLLSRVKPRHIIMYDMDIVDSTNLSGQLYCMNDVDNNKAAALSSTLENFSNYYATSCLVEEYKNSSLTKDIMICGFDNMRARTVFFEKWRSHVCSKESQGDKKKCLFIDGRLAAEELQILCITGDDNYNINKYRREFLFLDKEAAPTTCSYKQTTFCATMIGSLIVNLFVNFIANMCSPLIERDLPFYTEYKADIMYLKTES